MPARRDIRRKQTLHSRPIYEQNSVPPHVCTLPATCKILPNQLHVLYIVQSRLLVALETSQIDIAKEFDLPIDSMDHLPEREQPNRWRYCPLARRWKGGSDGDLPATRAANFKIGALLSAPTCTAGQQRNTASFTATPVTGQKPRSENLLMLVIGCMPCIPAIADFTVSIRHARAYPLSDRVQLKHFE